MKTNRRKFISTSIVSGLAVTLPLTSYGKPASAASSDALKDKYARLDEILKQPVFKKEFFEEPVHFDWYEETKHKVL